MERIVFIGSKEMGLQILMTMYRLAPEKLVACITLNDSSDTRSRLSEIDNFCGTYKIPIHVLEGKCDITELIHLYAPDICFVLGWYYIIPEHILETVPYGFIGVHNSLLPQYRGHAPLVWAMINGESMTGYSVFSFTAGMDEGNLWHQEQIKINHNDYIQDVLFHVEQRVLLFFENNYLSIINNEIRPYPQLEGPVSYGAKRTETDGHINWSCHMEDIYNFIRAQSRPYPGAYSYYGEHKVIIWRAREFPYAFYGIPGQVGLIDKENGEVTIVCGNNSAIILEEIQVGTEIQKPHNIIKSLNTKFH